MQMVRRDNRRHPKRNLDQVGQHDGDAPSNEVVTSENQIERPSTVLTEASGAAGTEETPAIDLDSMPKQHCSGCRRTTPLSDFPSKNNRILLTCVRCNMKLQNRRPPKRQMAPPHIGAAEKRRTAAVEKALTAALRVTEAIARQTEAAARLARIKAHATRAAEDEAVRRVVRASQETSRAMRASQEARRAAALQESMAAGAAAQAKDEAARLAAHDWWLPVYQPRFGPISTVQSLSEELADRRITVEERSSSDCVHLTPR
ncbi:hypothetical protein E4U57_007253 [Claviceps arundinis]|uniref:Uncharacterized protein n=1 Tax=Claviceps arundinis TaxID=1623583 RepID=A0ABQ7PFM5_9HYPO|nr:hypothetical protein E4U57_007253 [Claviceps arundinis]